MTFDFLSNFKKFWRPDTPSSNLLLWFIIDAIDGMFSLSAPIEALISFLIGLLVNLLLYRSTARDL